MLELVEALNFWFWFGLGFLLLAAEVFGTGGYFLWIGLAAIVVGVIKWLIPEFSWQWQLLVFAILSIVTAIGWWKYLKVNPQNTELPLLNQRGQQHVGRVTELVDAISNGRGRVRLDDSYWQVAGDDMPEGTQIKVVDVDNLVLKVEKVST